VGIKPFFEGVLSGEGRRRGDLDFFKLRFKVRPVRPDPVRAGGGGVVIGCANLIKIGTW